jgi:cytochrome d ubiquinol oxidase subunit II
VQVTCILWGWVLSQYPFIVPETVSIRDGAAPRETLSLLFIGLAVGTLVLAPSLRYLFRLFATPVAPEGKRAVRRRREKP